MSDNPVGYVVRAVGYRMKSCCFLHYGSIFYCHSIAIAATLCISVHYNGIMADCSFFAKNLFSCVYISTMYAIN